MEYVFYLGLGAVAGLISGLFGLGGGAVIVPLLIFSFAAQGISPEIATHLAIGTSLATIVVTSLSSIYTHHQKGAIRWELVKRLSPGIVIGSALGGLVAISLNGTLLQLMFGSFMICIGLQMLFYKTNSVLGLKPSSPLLAVAGTGIGGISALFGIGGGVLTTPLLSHYGVKIHQSVASAAACGFPIALVATLVYSSSGVIAEQLPGSNLGYIFVPAWLGIIVTSTPFARLGATLAHRANERILKQSFGWVVLLLGIRFIWINLPA
jgi:uncharacterized membrane protein YfcA